MIKVFLIKINGDGMITSYYDVDNFTNGTINAWKDGRPSTLNLTLQQTLYGDNHIFKVLNTSEGRNQILITTDDKDENGNNKVLFFGLIDQYNIDNEIGNITARSMDVTIYADKFESLMVLNYLLVNKISQTQQRFNIVDYIEAIKKQYGVFQVSSNLQLSGNTSIDMRRIQELRLYNIDQYKQPISYDKSLDVLRSFFILNFDPSKVENQPIIHLDTINKQLRIQKSNLYISPQSSYQIEQDQVGHRLVDKSIVITDNTGGMSQAQLLYDTKTIGSYSSYSIDLNYNDIPTVFYLKFMRDGASMQRMIVNPQLRMLYGSRSEEVDLTDTDLMSFQEVYDENDFQEYLSLSRYVKSRSINIVNPQISDIDFSQIYVTKIRDDVYIPIKLQSYRQAFDKYGVKINNLSGNILLNKYMDQFLIDYDVIEEDYLIVK